MVIKEHFCTQAHTDSANMYHSTNLTKSIKLII